MIGANAEAIDKAEDRELFREAMQRIGLETPRSELAHSLIEALQALEIIGLPAIIRPVLHPRRHRRRHRLQPRGVPGASSSAASTPRRPARC